MADLNGDGKLDLIASSPTLFGWEDGTMLRTILGNGDGTFQAPVAHFGFSGIVQILVADLNGDGRPDLLTVLMET